MDAAALATGLAGSLAVTVACAAWPSWRAAASRPEAAAATAAGRPPATGSLSRLLATPALYGVTWDATVGDIGSVQGILPAVPVIARDPDVAARQTGYVAAPLKIGGVAADAMAMNPGHGGSLLPVPVEGRLPQHANEIAVGARTLAAAGSHIGATVKVSLDGTHPASLRIVGVAVFPAFSDTLNLGKGSIVTMQGLLRLLPPGRVQNTPLLLGGSLGTLALLTIVHLLVTSVRRRRHDLAVLRTLGFTRGQVRSAVTWQSATLAAALAIGVPLGIVSGRLTWQAFSAQLGIVPEPRIALLALAVLAAAAFGLAAAAAVVPGESAARVSPATALRSE